MHSKLDLKNEVCFKIVLERLIMYCNNDKLKIQIVKIKQSNKIKFNCL